MPTYNPGNDHPSGIRPNGHIPADSSSGWRAAWFRTTVRRLGHALEGVEPERATVALSTRAIVIVLAVVLSACGGGSGAPTAPTPPPVVVAPPPTPPAPQAANIVIADAIEFVSCVNGFCTFRGLVRNTGNACAANISGESWVMSAQGQEVGRARWTMPSGTMLRPGEEAYYAGAGMPQAVLNHLDGRYFASFLFDSRSC